MFMGETIPTAKQQLKFRMAVTFKIFNEAVYCTLLFVLPIGLDKNSIPFPFSGHKGAFGGGLGLIEAMGQ